MSVHLRMIDIQTYISVTCQLSIRIFQLKFLIHNIHLIQLKRSTKYWPKVIFSSPFHLYFFWQWITNLVGRNMFLIDEHEQYCVLRTISFNYNINMFLSFLHVTLKCLFKYYKRPSWRYLNITHLVSNFSGVKEVLLSTAEQKLCTFLVLLQYPYWQQIWTHFLIFSRTNSLNIIFQIIYDEMSVMRRNTIMLKMSIGFEIYFQSTVYLAVSIVCR